jgi:hypothetical protein
MQTGYKAVTPGIGTAKCHGLWLMWGSLTDWVENRPSETPEAEEAMRRAASEWLTLADDQSAWGRIPGSLGVRRNGL